jgi:hypothetical protein
MSHFELPQGNSLWKERFREVCDSAK